MTNVDLHIDELVLDGFPAEYRTQIGEIVQSELGRIFAERGLPPTSSQGIHLGTVDGGAFKMTRATSVHGIGAQVATAIANSIYGGR